MFINNRTTLIGKLESTPYTPATPADADFNVRVKNIKYSREIQEFKRKLALGDLDMSESIMGKQTGTISFDVDLASSAVVDTAPDFGKFLKACGFKETVYVATGVGYVPHKDCTHIPMTFWVQEVSEGASPQSKVIKMSGCMGNVKFSLGSVGEPIQMNFEFKGSLYVGEVDVAFASQLDPTSLSTVIPPAVLSSCVTVNAIEQDLDKLDIDIGNDVQMWTDPCEATGVRGFYISGRDTKATLDPYAKLVADEPVYTDWKTAVVRDIDVTLTGAIPINLNAPKAQYVAVGNGDRNGALTAEKTFTLIRTSGNDSFELLQGSKV